MVNVLATESTVVLGQEKVLEKSNEITAIPKILEWLDVKGHTVTIDAMGCQYAVASQILQKENMRNEQPFTDYNKAHGRLETRECWVVNDVKWLRDMHENWSSIQSIVKWTP